MTIDLIKEKTAKFNVQLEKKGITKIPPLRVVACYDVSGSMQGVYGRGAVQQIADQILGAAFKLDDNGAVDVFTFDHTCSYIGTQTPKDYGRYVQDKILRGGDHNLWGSTRYDQCLRKVTHFLFDAQTTTKRSGMFGMKKEEIITPPDHSPALVLFFTDGAPDAGDNTAAILHEAANMPVYFHLIGVGPGPFTTLKTLADRYDNCGYVSLASFRMSDEEVYSAMVTDEFSAFVKKLPNPVAAGTTTVK